MTKTAKLVLRDDGTFIFNFSPISSYLGHGTYKVNGSRVTLNTNDGDYIYIFDIVGDTLVFDADASSDQIWYSGMTDGSVYK